MKFNYAMEALNAARLAPISVLCEKRADHHQPKKPSSLPIASISRTFQGGLALVSSALGAPALAQALTYEEALGQSVTTPAFDDGAGGVFDSVISFAAGNPIVIAGGVAVLAVPLVLSRIFGKPKPYGVESARKAYGVLGDDPSAQLLDIRAPVEVRKMGSPDVKGLGKKSVPIFYVGEDKPGFLKKLSLKFKDPESTTLYILDKFDGNSELVAELVTVNGFKAAYAIKDGAEGPKGWMNSSLPWILPKKSFSFDLGGISDSISDALGESFDALSVGLGLAAATGIALLSFSEMETILQVLGSAALVQFASKKLLYQEDRKETVKQLDEFLNTKIAPNELVDDIKQIGIALLPFPASGKSLPSPVPAAAESTVQKSEAAPVAASEPTAEAAPVAAPEPTAEAASVAAPEPAAEPAPEPALLINSVPKTEVKEEPVPSLPRPLSPYASYADFKPPSSPSPSQP